MRSKAIFVALLAFAFGAQAVPVSRDQARAIAQMWAARGKRLGVRMGTEVEEVSEYAPAHGRKFFAVRMKGGTVFTAGDTRANPVLAFTRERVGKLDPNSPLYKLLSEATRLQNPGLPSAVNAAERSSVRRWAALQVKADRITSSTVPIESEEEIDDVRVSPLLATKWGQSTVKGADGVATNCFNFYTPPTRTVIKEEMAGGYAETNESANCVCGCVATAMAQLMRYWCWPQGDRPSFENANCSAPFDTSILLGVFWGPGAFQFLTVAQNPVAETNLTTAAGAYDWENMLELPEGVAVEDNCKAIGKLTYDCGVSVGMDYNLAETGGSGIYTSEARNIVDALKGRFSYTNALLCTSGELTTSDSCRQKVIFANLDAKCPVLLLITGDGGHAVVGDGYGFDSGEGETLPYVHLNMGWTGQCDVWYNLPYINTDDNPEDFSGFDTIDGVVYNVFTNTTGWIISGRVLDTAGNPVPGTKVTLRDASNAVVGTCEAEGPSGIYAFFVPRGEGQYDVFAENGDGTKMADRLVAIKNDNSRGSNSWGNDLTLRDPTVQVTGADGVQRFASLDSALRVATNAGDRVEILHTTSLRRDAFLGNDLVLTAVKATPSKINRQNGATISITNGVAFFTNVVFALEKTTPVLVGSNGTIRVAGRVELDDIASMTPGIRLEGMNSFVLAGELLNGLTIASPATRAGQSFGSYSCDYVTATNSAGRIVTTDPDLVGQAVDGALKWQSAEEVDPLVAVAYLDGETPVYYRTLDKLVGKIRGEADIVVMRSGCTLTKKLTVIGDSSIRGEGANISVNVVGSSDAAQFTINGGASLSVSNLTFEAYRGMALFLVRGGGLTLESGTVIDGAVGTAEQNSGALAVSTGTVTVREGVRIVNCRAGGSSANGGAIWLAGKNCTLNLEGGAITGCSATTYGGGIYIGGKATLNLSGSVNVTGNSSGNNPVDNIYLAADTCSFNLVGEVSGSVGVRHSGSIAGDGAGDAFIAVDPSLDPDAVARSCAVFSNDTGDGLSAVVSEGGLVWAERPPYTGEVGPEAACDLVIYNDGTPQAVTNYYESFEYAYASLTNDATIVVLGAEVIGADVTVTRKVLIRTDSLGGSFGLYRLGECKFEIAAGGSLTLEDIVVSGYYGGKGMLLYVRSGGSLTLGNGALVCDVFGDGGRAAGGIVVWGGEFRMLPGSEIYNCGNDYPRNADEAVPPANVGVGGGLLVDSGTVYLEGGIVDWCWAEHAAGVYIGNKSTVYISGDMVICDNFTNDGEPSDLTVEDKSELLATDAFVLGLIGVSEGVNCDTNVFGRVPADVLAESGGILSATNFVATAACFHRDDDASVLGQVVTNGTEALLVWPRAIAGGVYVDEQGNSYGQVFGASCAVPVAPAGLVYNGGAQTGVVENAAYVIEGCGVATNAGQYVAVLTIKPGYLWEDGTAGQKEVVWKIGKATYDMSGITFDDGTFEYDGTPKSIYISGELPEGVTVEYTGNGQIKVCYKTEVRAHFTGDAENYEPIPYMVAHLTVFTTHPTIPVPPGFSWPYNGQEQVGVMDGVGYTVTGNRATEVGNYTAIASLTGDYRWMDGSADDKEVPWSIIKGNYDMSGVKFKDKTFAADGSPKSIFVDESTLPAGVSVTNYIGNGKTEVGTYQVRAQFAGDAMRYNKISDMFAWMTITDGPLPPPEPQWEIVTNHPTPIAFKSITRVSDTEWTLVITDRVEYCNYRLIWTDDLTKGFTSTGDWEHAVGPAADPVWTTNVITTGGAWFWRAEGADGTNMVLKTEE